MNAKEYIDTYGEITAEVLAKNAGTNLAYFRQLASGFRKPSPKLAKKLEAKSKGIIKKYHLLPDVYDAPQ